MSKLVKHETENMPDDYILINPVNSKYTVWKPISDKSSIRFMSYIIDKKKPSLNKIQGVKLDYLEETEIEMPLLSFVYRLDNISIKHIFWKIKGSSYFTTDKNDSVYSFKPNKTIPQGNIDIKYTDKYENIWSNKDEKGKKMSVWRPVSEDNYHILGDMILEGESNPNNMIHVPTVNVSTGKSVLYFDSLPRCYGKNNAEICFWKPKHRDGYSTLGDIATIGRKEPSNELLYSVPLENLNENSDVQNIGTKNGINLWQNKNMIVSCDKFKKPPVFYKLNEKYLNIERDKFDDENNIVLGYSEKNMILDIEDKIETVLSNKLDIEKSRLNVNSIDKINKKVYITLKGKRIGSIEDSSRDIINELNEIIVKKGIKLKDNHKLILIFNSITITERDDVLNIDNHIFKQNFN